MFSLPVHCAYHRRNDEQPRNWPARAPSARRNRRRRARCVHRLGAPHGRRARRRGAARRGGDVVAIRRSRARAPLPGAWRAPTPLTRTWPRPRQAAENGIDFVIIATPNHLHYPVARAFLAAGIHVVCDKPLALTVQEGEELVGLVADGRTLFALTHNYTGYPAVREARDRVRAGELGELRKVLVGVHPGLADGASGGRRATSRPPGAPIPRAPGSAGCIADIGTHAANLLEFVTGRQIEEVCADLTTVVPGRRLDDDANLLLRLRGRGEGDAGRARRSPAARRTGCRLRLYGTRGGLEWHQQEPNTLILKPAGRPWSLLRVGHSYLGESAAGGRAPAARTPGGLSRGLCEPLPRIHAGRAPGAIAAKRRSTTIPGCTTACAGCASSRAPSRARRPGRPGCGCEEGGDEQHSHRERAHLSRLES